MIKNTLFLLCIAFSADAQPCHLLKDINVGNSSSSSPFARMKNRVYFWATDENNERQLWTSDGNGAIPITNLELTNNGFGSAPMVINDSLLIFYSFTWSTGNELWRSDGNPGSETMITDLNPGSNGSISVFGRSDGKYTYFIGGGGLQNDLYRTDGTASGTILLKPGINGLSNLVYLGGAAYFKAYYQGDTWLLKTDGTPSGTVILTKIQEQNVTTIPDNLVVLDDFLYFFKQNNDESWGLWKTDGTLPGTEMMVQLNPPNTGHPYSLTLVKNRMFFVAKDSLGLSGLYVSDGTQNGTSVLLDIAPAGAIVSIGDMAALGDKLLFDGKDNVQDSELWISDGTINGTHLLKDLAPAGSSSPRFLFSHSVATDSLLFFMASTFDFGNELWQTDGTVNGTFMLQDICPGPCDSYPSNLISFTQQRLFFTAYSPQWGTEPWIYDPLNSAINNPQPTFDDQRFLLYPNPPEQNLINLSWQENLSPSTLEIINLHGQVIHHSRIESIQNTSRIILPELLAGMYFLRIYDQTGNPIGVEKLLIGKK